MPPIIYHYTMQIQELAQIQRLSERNIRRAIASIQQRGGQLTLDGDSVGGADLPVLVQALQNMAAQSSDKRPAITDCFWEIKQVSPVKPDATAGTQKERAKSAPQGQSDLAHLEARIAELESLSTRVAELESLSTRLAALEEHFGRVNKAMRHIALVLEDEEVDNNLYNILIGHIGGFNTRLTSAEQSWAEIAKMTAGHIVKTADDMREVKQLIRDLMDMFKAR